VTASIVAVTAGLSQPSSSRLLAERLARATADQVPGATVTVIELRELAHEIANAVLTGFPSGALADAVDAIRAADGVIMVSPVFNASYSGLFKSFVDVLEPETLTGKPVIIGATGGTARHSLALEFAFRPLFAYLRAQVVPTAIFAASEDFGGTSAALSIRIGVAAGELAAQVRGVRPATTRAAADAFDDPIPFDQLLAG